MIKGLGRRGISWIILVNPKFSGKCLYKSEAEGDLTWRRGGSNVTMKQRLELCGHMSRNVCGH